jgi:hypothetical protein
VRQTVFGETYRPYGLYKNFKRRRQIMAIQGSDGNWYNSQVDADARMNAVGDGGSSKQFLNAQAELAGAVAGASLVGGAIAFKILVKILTIIGFVFAILPGLILGLIMKIPLLGRVIHTAIFAVVVTIFLVSICLTVGTALGHYEYITFGFMNDLTVIGEIGGLDKGENIGQVAKAFLDTFSPAVIFPCLALGVLAAIIFFWGKLYYWEKEWDIINFIIVTGIALAVCIIGGIITMIVGKFAPIWIKGLLNSIFIALAFFFWYTQAKEDRPWTEEEIKQMTRDAEAGDPKAQDKLGWAYNNGKGVKVDMEKALFWCKKAAAQGYQEAIDSIPYLYSNLKTNEKEVEMLTRDAEAGNPVAQYALGDNYYWGKGIFKDKRDRKKGIMWMEKAAAQGQQSAIAELEKLKKEGFL